MSYFELFPLLHIVTPAVSLAKTITFCRHFGIKCQNELYKTSVKNGFSLMYITNLQLT